jgi:replicative DNA helicase
MEAEQALLGLLLYDPEHFQRVPEQLKGAHFFEPFHGALFDSIASAFACGLTIEPVAIAEEFRGSPAFKELGGMGYLIDLVDQAPAPFGLEGYAKVIADLSHRRDLMRLALDIAAGASGADPAVGAVPVAQMVEALEAACLKITAPNRRETLTTLAEAAAGVVDYIDDDETPAGVMTGLAPLDAHLGPLLPGDLILLGGRPSMGKSAVSLAQALNVAAPQLADMLNGRDYDGRPPMGVIEIHGEMSWNAVDSQGRNRGGQTARRHICDVGFHLYGRDFPTYKALRARDVTAAQKEMVREVAAMFRGLPIVGLKRTGITVGSLRSLVRRQKVEWARQGIGLGLVVVDHAGLIRDDNPRSGRYEAQTNIAIGSKELADDVGAPMIVLLQLSRDVERRDDKRPQLADLRDSGAWEENADMVVFAYRDAYYAAREEEPEGDLDWAQWDARRRSPDIDLICGKVREGEAGGAAKVWGDLAYNAIRSSRPEHIKGELL